ncbi:hypothetical protein X566_07005 [Afipia sp. P52-10]|jgi:hypothetical protein|uniref:hypothetical protein n=1 Tax=Afipia sp. P52-10 TaxID=1429916 RepID=UPI0003DF1624|nr:hypothetical protein [Afipia sp. P52-10]ETR77403.1 hypothetical protein X566_07005 [Afipia sp. P52-10]
MTYRSAYHLTGLVAATAAIAVFGGLHFEDAAGRNLDTLSPDDARIQSGTTLAVSNINRTEKADRSQIATVGSGNERTITFQLPNLPATTIAIRVGETAGAGAANPPTPSAGSRFLSGEKPPRRIVACEGVVSALTEVAKHLQPGRCVT